MRIALLGTRGIPASYGGFETFAEELSTRLVERGHKVAVYCRTPPPESEYRGVKLLYVPTWRHKYAETLAHTFLSTLQLIRRRRDFDAALYCNGANALFTGLARAAGLPVAINVDGLERKRRKWNRLARAWYFLSEWLSTWLPDCIVTDARHIEAYYRDRWKADSVFIPYGAPTGKLSTHTVLDRLGLEPQGYFLYVSRFEPENNALMVRRAFEKSTTPLRLALVGDAPYAAAYIREVKATRDPRILIPGAIYGEGYHELQSHSFAYIHATEVGGTHPALIEAMGRGALVLYLRTPENHEVAGGAGIPFSNEDELAHLIEEVTCWPAAEQEKIRRAAMQRVEEHYSWDAVTGSYEALLDSLIRRKSETDG